MSNRSTFAKWFFAAPVVFPLEYRCPAGRGNSGAKLGPWMPRVRLKINPWMCYSKGMMTNSFMSHQTAQSHLRWGKDMVWFSEQERSTLIFAHAISSMHAVFQCMQFQACMHACILGLWVLIGYREGKVLFDLGINSCHVAYCLKILRGKLVFLLPILLVRTFLWCSLLL